MLDQMAGAPRRGGATPGEPAHNLHVGLQPHAESADALRREHMKDFGRLQLRHGGVRNAAQVLGFRGAFAQAGNESLGPGEHVVMARRNRGRRGAGPDGRPGAIAGVRRMPDGSGVGREHKRVAGVVALCGQVTEVGRGRMDAGGNLPGHLDAEAGQLGCLVRVVAEQSNRAGTHGTQHLGSRRVVPLVLAVPQGKIRLIGVQAAVLQRVRVKLGIQADAAAFLAKVEQEPSSAPIRSTASRSCAPSRTFGSRTRPR